jgi:hypothetical protein
MESHALKAERGMRIPNILEIFQILNLGTRSHAQYCESDTIRPAKVEIYHNLGGQDSMAVNRIVSNNSEESQICRAKFFADFSAFFF